jgi:hypothetical protein
MHFFIRFTFLLTLLFSTLITSGIAQKILQGRISDTKTGEFMEAATVQITGTYRGTITNSDGEFELLIPSFPTELSIRFIGYTSKVIQLSEMPDFLEVKLEPIAVDLREVVVTGEDPAIGIMREVIRRKPIWRDALNTFQAEAYSRQRLLNDTGIVTITESLSDVFWDKRHGTREVITSRTQSSNIDPAMNFASATNLPNFYDDDIPISGFQLVGVTHPRALDYYHFKLEGFRQLDDKTVFDISVSPKRKLQPTFEGVIAVLDEDFALIEVDLKPGESVMFPPPIQEFGLAYEQQFSNFGGQFWLPVDVRINGTIKIGFPGLQFPSITFNQLSRLTNYEVNGLLPDALYAVESRVVVDTLGVGYAASESRIQLQRVPLDEKESQAYAKLDSTQTLEKAFMPTGPLARFVETSEDEGSEPGPLSRFFGNTFDGVVPQFGYNRVDGGRLGMRYNVPFKGIWRPFASGEYTTVRKEWDYKVGSEFRFRNKMVRAIKVSYGKQTGNVFGESMYDSRLTASYTLFGAQDYFDYYLSTGGTGSIEVRPGINQLKVFIGGGLQDIRSMQKLTNYSLPGGILQRENLSVDEGRDVYSEVKLVYGDTEQTWGAIGSRSASLTLQWASDAIGSDFEYTRWHADVTWRFNTFYKRRFMPNTLDLRLVAGTTLGTEPLHRLHGLDVALGRFSPFGTFRTAGNLPVLSTELAALHWEHNFRTIPFELIGLQSVAKKGVGIIVYGSHGVHKVEKQRLWSTGRPGSFDKDDYHELGMSVNGLFSLLRLDLARQLNGNGYFIGFSIARVF